MTPTKQAMQYGNKTIEYDLIRSRRVKTSEIIVDENKILIRTPLSKSQQAFYYDGKFIKKWGTFGNGDGQFNRPAGITINPKDKLVYVSDTVNNRIQVFDTDGNFVKKWGSLGLDNTQFARPDEIFFGPSERAIYVADRQNHRIQVFDTQGAFITKWVTIDSLLGKEIKPRDITIDHSGKIYVVDKENNQVQVYGIGPTIQQTNEKKTATKTGASESASVTIQRGSSIPSNGKFFVPDTLIISKGTTVTWSNHDSTLHTVTSGSPNAGNSGVNFDSSYVSEGKKYRHTFNTDGTFRYYCTLHPFMKGKIVVR